MIISAYTRIIIFYFSGTGNARKVAEWISEIAKLKQIHCELFNIADFGKMELPEINPSTLLGICGPTHGFNFPPIVLNFLIKLPGFKGASAFIINTRAGMKLYKLFLPGLSGIAQYFAAFVLKLKGYHIVGMQPMDLPSNWISLHPGLREKVVHSIFERCKKITGNFAEHIINGGRKYKALWSLPFDLAVAPVSLLYYIVGRFAIAKTFVASSKCNKCYLCIKQCPVKAIKMVSRRPFWTFNCESCMQCMNNCPHRAIETAFGFTFIIWWGIMSFVPVWILTNIFEGPLEVFNKKPFLYWLLYNALYVGAFLIIIFI